MHSRHNSFLIEQISTNTKTSLSKSSDRKWSGCSTWLSRARSTRWCSLLIGNFSETPEDNSTAVRKSVGSAPEMASATAKCWLRFQLTRGNAPRLAIDKSRLRASRFPRILGNVSSAGSTMLASAPRVSFTRPTRANSLRKKKSGLRKAWFILDWKTNRIERNEIGKLRADYRPQIAAYWKAVTEMTKQQVGGGIFSTATGQLIVYDQTELANEWKRLRNVAGIEAMLSFRARRG